MRFGIPMLAACVSEAIAFNWLLPLPFSFTPFLSVGKLLVDRFLKMVCQPVLFCQVFLTVKYCCILLDNGCSVKLQREVHKLELHTGYRKQLLSRTHETPM